MSSVEQRTIDTIRVLSADMVQKANSGHPGLPMGAAPIAYTLWGKYLKHNPTNPKWIDRDRFVLSAGHGSALLYSLLHLFGYGLTIDDLMQFRQSGSKTPGHPEHGHTIGVEATTGPLGQGIANGVGMAMAEAHLANKFNRPQMNIVDHYTYVLCGDGCMMEGISYEAASLAGTLALGKLILLYDSNSITIEGSTSIAFKEDVAKRFVAFNWQVIKVEDGNDTNAIGNAIELAKADTHKPSLIVVTTQIGYGCSAKQGKASAHGEPLGAENIASTKACFGFPEDESFFVSEDVKNHMDSFKENAKKKEKNWNSLWDSYSKEYPELAKEFDLWNNYNSLLEKLDSEEFWNSDDKANATRSISGDILNRVAEIFPNLIGGSADLAPSTKTLMKGRGDFSASDRSGSNLHFGVREHAMAGIANGMSLHGGLIPYISTFFVFSDYMKPSIRLAAIMGLPVIYVFTHDSIGVGEDGPTHQPIEQLACLRSIPNINVFRPADSKETIAGWVMALKEKNTPTALILTRQNLPQYNETGNNALKGGYVLFDSQNKKPEIILMASGSEVQLVYQAGLMLKEKGIAVRVVSMPCLDMFESQTEEYKESVLPKSVRARVAVEAASSFGWHKYVGMDGKIISIDHFGASAPAEILFREYGFTVENVVEKALSLL